MSTQPAWLKFISIHTEYLRSIKEKFPHCKLIYRHYKSPQDQILREDYAHKFSDELLRALDEKRIRDLVFGAEGYNETGLWNDGPAYRKWTQIFAQRMRTEGLKSVGFNFSTGNPPELWLWKDYIEALYDIDYLGLHAYGYPSLSSDADWQLLRYRKLIHGDTQEPHRWEGLPTDLKNIPILLTEIGIDSGNQNIFPNKGYKSIMSDEEYAKQLQWAHEELNKDPNIKAAFIFLCGT